MRRRFLTLAEVAEELQVSKAQAYALVRAGTLPGIKIGGRGQWRVEAVMLEAMIARAYVETRAIVAEHPLGGPGDGVTRTPDPHPSGSGVPVGARRNTHHRHGTSYQPKEHAMIVTGRGRRAPQWPG